VLPANVIDLRFAIQVTLSVTGIIIANVLLRSLIFSG
jgi:hypothetical protein